MRPLAVSAWTGLRSSATARGSMSAALWNGTRLQARGPKLDEKASKLLVEDLRRRPRSTHAQRAQFVLAVFCGVRVSETTICRAIKCLSHSRKKDPKERQNETIS